MVFTGIVEAWGAQLRAGSGRRFGQEMGTVMSVERKAKGV